MQVPLSSVTPEFLRGWDTIHAVDLSHPDFDVQVWGQNAIPRGGAGAARTVKKLEVGINSIDAGQLRHLLQLVKSAFGYLPPDVEEMLTDGR